MTQQPLTDDEADAIIYYETFWTQARIGPARTDYDAETWQPGDPLYDARTRTNVARHIIDILDDSEYLVRHAQQDGLVVCPTCLVAWRCHCYPDTGFTPDTELHECPETCWYCGQAAA